MDSDGITKMIEAMDTETQNIRLDVLKLCWYMRGGVTSQDLFHLYSYEDRNIMSSLIKENIEATKKSGMPLL